MAGTTNFLQWNPGASNQETDSAYLADDQRISGAPNGTEFPSATANKVFYQSSTFIAALANTLANKGYSPLDTSLSTLESVLANMVTFADLKPGLISVAFSTTPSFNAANSNGFDFVMAGNVTNSTLTGQQIGQTITFVIKQGSVPYTFVPPTGINGWFPINPAANSVTVQSFIVREDGSIWPTATELNVLTNSFANSLTPNGYQKLPGGLVIQWALSAASVNGRGQTSISWPITFPNGFFGASVSARFDNPVSGTNNQGIAFYVQPNSTLSTLQLQYDVRPDGSADSSYRCFAIGLGY